ncbi:MAG TPA: universal stress protein [Halobacteriales archaeon]|nr:universal stress protein [Halobacteriales archaeon]
MYDRILLPTDGSEVAESAASHAVALAAATGAQLHVLYVVDAEAIGLVTPVTLDVDEVRTSLRHAGEEATAAVAEAAEEAGVDVVEVVEVGVPGEEIRDYAAANGVDLVVMGTHGRSGVDRFLLGSVTERVVRGSGVPVLAVPPAGADPVLTAEDAIDRARAAVEAEGAEPGPLREAPYRERTTWVVPLELADGGSVNAHVDAATGAVRTARLD